MILFETDRLRFRNLKVEDLEIMYDYRNNKKCSKYQRGQVKKKNEIEALISNHLEDELSIKKDSIFAVELKNNNEMIGEIVIMPVENTFSLGFTFSYKHHRKGYAFEVLNELMSLLHNKYSKAEFICFVEKENIASIKLLKKLGYDYIGYLKSNSSEVFAKYLKKKLEL